MKQRVDNLASETLHQTSFFLTEKSSGSPSGVCRQGPSVRESRATLTVSRHGLLPDGSSSHGSSFASVSQTRHEKVEYAS